MYNTLKNRTANLILKAVDMYNNPCILPTANSDKILIVDIVNMTNVRLEIIKHNPQLFSCLGGVNRLNGISQLRQLAAAVEIHIARISIHSVSNAAPFMLHPEVLDFIPLAF